MTEPKAKVKSKAKGKAGRPKAVVNWKTVDSMCKVHCTGEEQAAILGINYDTLNAACKRDKKMDFSDYYAQKSAGGKMSLRRKQFASAAAGNPTMLIWLGKNWLGQSDAPKSAVEDETESMSFTFSVAPASKEIKVTRGEGKS